MDQLIVRDLLLINTCGPNQWEFTEEQPLLLSINAFINLSRAAEFDLLSDSVSYAALAKTALQTVDSLPLKTLESLSTRIADALLDQYPLQRVIIKLEKPRALLHATSVGIQISRPIVNTEEFDMIFIKDLTANCIIGIFPWERIERQRVIINLELFITLDQSSVALDSMPRVANYRTVCRSVTSLVEQTSFKTVEALALAISNLLTIECGIPKVKVRVEKPSAITFASGAGVEVVRTSPKQIVPSTDNLTCYLSIGSNLGDRLDNIQSALKLLKRKVAVTNTSFLYETAPMYLTEQPKFLNACTEV